MIKPVAYLIAAVALASAAWAEKPATAPAGPEKIKLTPVVLGSAVPVYSPAGGRSITFSASHQVDTITVGDFAFDLGWAPGRTEFAARFANGSVRPVRVGNNMAEPVAFEIAKGKPYSIAFPSAFVSRVTASVRYRPGVMLRGTIGGQQIALFDDNMDGKYDLTKDAVRFGINGGNIAMFSKMRKYVAAKGAVVELQDLSDTLELTVQKYAGPTGKLNVVADLASEMHVLVHSDEVSITAAPTPRHEFTVVPGEYKMTGGAVYSTSLRKIVAVVSSAEKAVTVEEGKTAVLQVGAPLALQFPVAVQGRRVTVSPSFAMVGRGAEKYTHLKPVGEPIVYWVINGQISQAGRMEYG